MSDKYFVLMPMLLWVTFIIKSYMYDFVSHKYDLLSPPCDLVTHTYETYYSNPCQEEINTDCMLVGQNSFKISKEIHLQLFNNKK